jgi:predicted lipoprotein
MKSIHLGIFHFLVCALLVCSCVPDKDDPAVDTDNSNDRKIMLTHYADEIIIPGYANFKIKLDVLDAKSDAFTGNPTLTTLTEFRQAWLEAYIEWQKVELYDVGPASFHSTRSFFNIYPASVQGINDNIAITTAPNLDVPSSYATQGFPALDYLLNGLGATDDDILAFYTTASDASKRKEYVTTLVTQMTNKLNVVISEWSTYRDQFVNNTSMEISGSTSLLVNGYVLNYERYLRSGKFGIPSGAMVAGTPMADHVEAYYKKDISLTLAKTAQQASVDFFNGKSVKTGLEGSSLKTYLNSIGAKDNVTGSLLTQIVNEQFAVVDSKLNLLTENLSNEVSTNNQAMVNVYTEMDKVVRLIKVDMTSAMSVTITYTDNDGD